MNQANSSFSLHNLENYKQTFEYSLSDLISKQNTLIIEYLNFISDNIPSKNTAMNKFIIIRGLDTITHVFNTILYYSKNIDLAFYHGQKAFYFYVEFIGQITNDQHIFLNLSSRDATLFVYKKTIFDINIKKMESVSMNMNADINEKMDILNINKNIIKNALVFFIENSDSLLDKEHLKWMIEKINKLLGNIHNMKMNKKSYEIIIQFVEAMNKNMPTNNYNILINLFIKKLSKHNKPEIYNILKEKMCLNDFEHNLLNNNNDVFIQWLFL